MVRAAGFEPADDSSQGAKDESFEDPFLEGYTQISAQISDADRRLLAKVVESWPRLNGSLKLAVLAVVEASKE
jgi:hypothetical protein